MNRVIVVAAAFVILIVLALLTGCSGLRFVVEAVPSEDRLTETTVIEGDRSTKIALIDLTGLIIDARKPGLISDDENPVARFAESLRRASSDGSVRAVIVRINSPGGTVTASDVAYRELMHFREETRKPVVILMADVAASGGYYVACAGDELIAHPTTITGSIGVIMQTFNFAEGMNRIGIHADAITSGESKDVGNPFEPMPDEHRALLQGIVNEFYDNFATIVAASRAQIDADDFALVTDGRVVTGRHAAELGLVDSIGDLYDAFDAAQLRAGITDARLVKYHRPLEYVGSPYASSPGPAAAGEREINLLQLNLDVGLGEQVGFYYLWDPAVW
jgi:protease-4